MAKVYISCHHPEPANELAAALLAAGHEVVSTWHAASAPRPSRDDAAAWRAKASENFLAIQSADCLAIIAGPDRYPGGKFVEAGYAIGCGKPVFAVGGIENGMLHAAIVTGVDSVEGLVSLLAT